MEEQGAVVDYSKLLDELLVHIIENHIVSVVDFINFSCVCRSWRRATNACDLAKLRKKWARHQMPWLMLTDGVDGPEIQPLFKKCIFDGLESYYSSIDPLISCQRSLLNLSMSRSRCKSYDFNSPEMYKRACWGSPYGWVVTLGVDREMHLFNPFTRAQLPLPNQSVFREVRRSKPYILTNGPLLTKAVLLRVPSKYHGVDNDARVCDNYDDDDDDDGIWLVVLIHGNCKLVATAMPGDNTWTILVEKRGWFIDENFVMQDVFYSHHMSSLIFVGRKANLFYSDLHDLEHPQKIKPYIAGPPSTERIGDKDKFYSRYIIESNGNILIVNKKTVMDETYSYHTCNFSVYKLDESTKSWEEVKDLQGVSLFLGLNVSMSINAQDAGCRSNCIYFCDDLRTLYGTNIKYVGGHDMGVYSLDDGMIQPLYTGDHSRSSHCCPFWLSPMLLKSS